MRQPWYIDRANRQSKYRQDTRTVTILSVYPDPILGATHDVILPGFTKPVRGVRAMNKGATFLPGSAAILGWLDGCHHNGVLLGGVNGGFSNTYGLSAPSYYDDDLYAELEGKVDRGGDTLSGILSGDGLDVDFPGGMVRLPGIGAMYGRGGELYLSDTVAGEKSLSQLAEVAPAGPGYGKFLVSADDKTPGYLEEELEVHGGATLSTSNPGVNEVLHLTVHDEDHAARHLWGAADYMPMLYGQTLLEATFDRLLQGRLTDGGAATISYTFGAAPSNNGVGAWGGSGWSLAAGYRSTNTATDTFTFVVNLPYQGAVTFDRGTAALLRSSTVQIAVDGGAPTTWDQVNNRTKATAALAAGAHSIVVTANGADALHCCSLAGVSYGGYAYAGQGVAGDTFKVLLGQPTVLAHTLGIGATRTNLMPAGVYAPDLSTRLPAATTTNDYNLAGATILPAGWTNTAGAQPVYLFPVGCFAWSFIADFPRILAGDQLTLTTNTSTRGRRATAADGTPRSMTGPALSATCIHDNVWAALVRVDTPGAGSNFVAGELALFVAVTSNNTNSTNVRVTLLDADGYAADLFKIPTDLL